MRVNVFDRVLQRNDMNWLRPVDFVEHGGNRRGLSGAGGTRDEHQAGLFVGEQFDRFRELQRFEAGNGGVQLAADNGVVAALGENVDAETGLVRKRVGGVARAAPEQVLDMPQVFTDQVQGNHFRLK